MEPKQMNRALDRRIRHLEDLAAQGRADGYILAEQVRHTAGGLPREQWYFIRDRGFVPFASAARAAHRLLNLLLERPPPVTDDAYWLVDDILWYLDNKRYWRPEEGWHVLWRFQRHVLPRLPVPGEPDDRPQVPTAVLRDIEEPLAAHNPDYASPFKPRRVHRLPRRPKPGTRPEDCLPPSMHIGNHRRERPAFFEEKPYIETIDPQPLW